MTQQETLIAQAAAAHVQYPQYAGHWDGWQVVQIKKDIRTKAGLAFAKGDYVLRKPGTHSPECGPHKGKSFIVCYSFRNKMDTSIMANKATATCPYCHTAVKDTAAINGISPISGSGCEFCNPQGA